MRLGGPRSDVGLLLIVVAMGVFYVAPFVRWIDQLMPQGNGVAFATRAVVLMVMAFFVYRYCLPLLRKILPLPKIKPLSGWRSWSINTLNFLYLLAMLSFLLITVNKEWSGGG